LKRGLYLGTKKKQKGGYIKGRREYNFGSFKVESSYFQDSFGANEREKC